MTKTNLETIDLSNLVDVNGGDQQTFQYLCSQPGPNGNHIDRVTFHGPFSVPDHSPCAGMGVKEQGPWPDR